MTTLTVRVASPREAHGVMNNLYQGIVKPYTSSGAAGVITWQTHNEWLRTKMRAAFHGPILKAISEQVWFTDAETGVRYRHSKAAWKIYLKREFLEPRIEEYIGRGGEIKLRQKRLSTEDLSDDEYSEFLQQVQAFACIDLGVEFDEEGLY